MTPNLGQPPVQYVTDLWSRILRNIEQVFTSQYSGFSTGSAMDFSMLPLSGYNVQVGGLYVADGFVKVVRSSDTFAPTLTITSKLGSVTTTP